MWLLKFLVISFKLGATIKQAMPSIWPLQYFATATSNIILRVDKWLV